MWLLIRYDQSGHFYEQRGKMLYKYFKSVNKCALIIFMLNLKGKEWKTQLQHTGLVLFVFNRRRIAHCCLYFYLELSQIISEVYHIKPLAWFKASAAALNLFRNTEPGYDCSERYGCEKLTGPFMRRVWEFLEHFTDAPTGTTHNSKPWGTRYRCYAFNFIALYYTANTSPSLNVFSDLCNTGPWTLNVAPLYIFSL